VFAATTGGDGGAGLGVAASVGVGTLASALDAP
jgi:hypothetical protein